MSYDISNVALLQLPYERSMNQLYKQHFEDMQNMNQQWFNLLWRPFTRRIEQQQEQ
jgi:hypothetical protein